MSNHNDETDENYQADTFCWVCGEEGHLPGDGCARRAGMW